MSWRVLSKKNPPLSPLFTQQTYFANSVLQISDLSDMTSSFECAGEAEGDAKARLSERQMLCLTRWPASTWQASPAPGLPELSSGTKVVSFCLSRSDLGEWKQEGSSASPALQLLRALFSLPLHAGWYRSGRLNSSSDEFPGFVWWRKFAGHDQTEAF